MSLVAPDYPDAQSRRAGRPRVVWNLLSLPRHQGLDRRGLRPLRVDLAPTGGAPGPHFHKTMSESFFVLSGTMSLFDGRSWFDRCAGDFLYVPPRGIHGFRNEADQPASMLMSFAPGAPREDYFEGLADLAETTNEERREFFIRHDNYCV
jgi:mannose-6-phosphate isomerase-like protein (cupin superfamily)